MKPNLSNLSAPDVILLTHLFWVDSSTWPLWTSPFPVTGVSGQFLLLPFFIRMPVINANSVNPDQMLHSAASDLGLHCLPMSHLWALGTNGLMCYLSSCWWTDLLQDTRMKIHFQWFDCVYCMLFFFAGVLAMIICSTWHLPGLYSMSHWSFHFCNWSIGNKFFPYRIQFWSSCLSWKCINPLKR